MKVQEFQSIVMSALAPVTSAKQHTILTCFYEGMQVQQAIACVKADRQLAAIVTTSHTGGPHEWEATMIKTPCPCMSLLAMFYDKLATMAFERGQYGLATDYLNMARAVR